MVELKMDMIIDNNPFLINAVDRNTSHPILCKYSQINENTEYNWWL